MHLTKYNNLFFSSLLLILVASCATIDPDVPEIIVTEHDIPDPDLSTIQIPIKINLAPYFKETEASVPTTFDGNEQTCEGVSFSYKFVRSPIVFAGKKNALQFDVDGKYSLNINYCPQCTELFNAKGTCIVPRIYASCGVGEPMRKIHVSYETKIGVTENYRLSSNTSLRQVKALTPCEITVFNYDATSKLEAEVSNALKAVERDIDKEISSVDLRPEMEATWNLLTEPIDLGGYGFLYIRPTKVAMSDIKFNGDTAYFSALLKAIPTIRSETTEFEKKKLPKLSNYENHDGFDINMDIVSMYDSISAMLTAAIKGKSLELKGKQVVFGDIQVHGASKNQLSIKVDFSGKKSGTLYLQGTPRFDEKKQFISFPDLTFDVDTKDALLKSAKWLFDNKITETLREYSAMDLTEYIDTLKNQLNASLNYELTEGVLMKGRVEDVKINFIYPLDNQLHIRLRSLGKLELEM